MKKITKITNYNPFIFQVSNVSRTNRWKIHHRLQELNISSWCFEDGTLWVEANDCIKAILLHSIVKQNLSNHSELINWLEKCWSTQILSVISG